MVKLTKFCSEIFTVTLIDVLFKFCETLPTGIREIGKIVRYLPNKKIRLPFKLSLLCRSRSKSAWASPQQYAHSAPDFRVIAERVNTVFYHVEYFHDRLSKPIIMYTKT